MVSTLKRIAAVSALCIVAIGLATGEYGLGSGREAGQAIGGALAVFAVGALAAILTRLVAGTRGANAGLIGGVLAAVASAGLLYVGLTA